MELHRLPTPLAVDRVLAVPLGLDLDDHAAPVPAPDQEVRRVAAPPPLLVQVLDEELGLARVREGAGEVDVLHVARVLVELPEDAREEISLGPGIEVVRVVVEAEVVLEAAHVAEPEQQVRAVLVVGDLGGVHHLPVLTRGAAPAAGVRLAGARVEPDQRERDVDALLLHGVAPRLPLDLLAQRRQVAERHLALGVKAGQLVVERPYVRVVVGRELDGGAAHVQRIARHVDRDRLARRAQHAARGALVGERRA